MNMHVHSMQPADPLAPRGPMSCSTDMEKLRSMDMKQIYDLRDALHTIAEVVCGLSCQMRFMDEEKAPLANAAGEALGEIVNWLSSYEQAVINVARAAEPTDAETAECRALALISFEACFEEDLLGLASIVNSEVGKALAVRRKEGGR